jgi:polar amino acid transport system substrate-binding protein
MLSARYVFVAVGMLATLFGFELHASDKAQKIKIYTYHTHEPFVSAKGKGLTYDLADFLTEYSEGRFMFSVSEVSRPRLNKLIEKERNAIVPWVNPMWFKDKDETKYIWSQNHLMQDGNAIVSLKEESFEYNAPPSIEGKVLGGLKGHRYVGIDEFISETGKAKRVDADFHRDNFVKLQNGSVDIMLIPLSAANYEIKQQKLSDKVHISEKGHTSYKRKIMVLTKQHNLPDFIESALFEMEKNKEWEAIMAKYK